MGKNKKIIILLSAIIAVLVVAVIVLCLKTSGTQVSDTEAEVAEATDTQASDYADFEYLYNDTFVMLDGSESSLGVAVDSIVADADTYMEELSVDASDQDLINADIKETLYKEQDESERRCLGDHGIRHALTNWQKAKCFLDTRDDATTEIYFASLIACVYHDCGYEVYPCNESLLADDFNTSDHDKYSAVIEEHDETFAIYKKILSEDTLDALLYAVRTHNSSDEDVVEENTSADGNLIAVSLNLSDKCALSLREKLPSSLENCPEAFKAFLAFYPYIHDDNADELFEDTLSAVKDAINSADVPEEQLDDYLYMCDIDLYPEEPKYGLRFLYCYQAADGISYNASTGENDILLYRVKYGIDGEEKVQQKVISKLFEDLMVQGEDESDDDYDERIEKAYEAACTEDGYSLEDGRGLHITVKEMAVEDIPGTDLDYTIFADSIDLE